MTFENETYKSFKDARQHIIGEGDSFQYYNPKTGRPIKKLLNYNSVILYSYNDRMGYKGMVLLKKTPQGVTVVRELFDQEGYSTFNDMFEIIKYG